LLAVRWLHVLALAALAVLVVTGSARAHGPLPFD
jgi:hypothetical protein